MTHSHGTSTRLEARPGGTLRFLISATVVLLILAGVIVGMRYWMLQTPTTGSQGPRELKYPENRPFR